MSSKWLLQWVGKAGMGDTKGTSPQGRDILCSSQGDSHHPHTASDPSAPLQGCLWAKEPPSKDKYSSKCSRGEVAQPLQLTGAFSSSSLGCLRALRVPWSRVLHGMGWAQGCWILV